MTWLSPSIPGHHGHRGILERPLKRGSILSLVSINTFFRPIQRLRPVPACPLEPDMKKRLQDTTVMQRRYL